MHLVTSTLFSNGLPPFPGRLLGRPLQPFGRLLLPGMIQQALAHRIDEGSLDFLGGHVVGIGVTDLGIAWKFTLDERARRIRSAGEAADASIQGDSAALLLLASQRIDPDTLFFRRRLALEGDTELGLHLKNVLDTLEPEDLPPPLARFLDHAGRMAERWS